MTTTPRREEWAKRVERWERSGKTAKEFAAENGFNVQTLQHWKWKLGAEGSGRAPRVLGRGRTGFVEIIAPLVRGSGVAGADAPLELVLAGGGRLRIPVGFDAGTLQRVVELLGGR